MRRVRDGERWRGAPMGVRLDHFKHGFIEHPDNIQIKLDLEDKEETSRFCSCSEGILVVGEPGSGKTTLAGMISRWWPDVEMPALTIRPVVHMKVPKPCNSFNLVKSLLKGLGDPNWDQGKEGPNRARALCLMKECKVRFLVVDNFHDVPERRDVGGVRVIGNWFRDIADDAAIVLVLLGTKEAEDVTLFNDQVKRRVMTKRHLRYFGIETPAQRKQWIRLLHEIDMDLPLAGTSSLTSKDIAGRVYVATNGIFDYLSKLLIAALKLAVKDGHEHLTLADLHGAYLKCHGDVPGGSNPFDKDFLFRRLDQIDEPFFRPRSVAMSAAA